MPIKFRCDDCRQLLGIARRKAGTEVNCPRCGKILVVPPEDQVDEGDDSPEPAESSTPALLERDDFDALLSAPQRVRVPVAQKAEAEPARNGGVGLAIDRSTPIVSTEGPMPFTQRQREKLRTSPAVKPWQLAALAVVSLLGAFLLGIVVGREVFPDCGSAPASARNVAAFEELNPQEPLKQAENKPEPAKAVVDDSEMAKLIGNITYKQDGQERPDEGSVVLIFDSKERPERKFDVRGLRPSDKGQAGQPGVDQLRRFGGQIAYVDSNGQCQTASNKTGYHWVLILSNHLQLPPGHEIYTTDQTILRRYFTDIDALIENRQYFLLNRDLQINKPQDLKLTFE